MEQTQLWNGTAGRAWVEAQELLDRLFRPFEDLLVASVAGSRVLDVGCGTGSTTVAIARRTGACTGIDISEPMIAAARQRNESRAAFICADAETYAFEPASYDTIVSRFGVMFFSDPVRAFANLRTAGKALCFLAWRTAAENPFMTTAEQAAAPLLPNLPARATGGPGQFAFADHDHVRRILEEAGWRNVTFERVDVPCTMPESSLVPYLTHLGPVGRALAEAGPQTRSTVIPVVRAAFDRFVHGDEVRFTAACWMVRAYADSSR